MQAVLDYLKQNSKRFIDDLCEYLRFPSVSAQSKHKQDMTACAQWLVRRCRGLGLETQLHSTAGHPIVVAKTRRQKGTKKPAFLVYGHYDVQPPEPFELWKSPPFEPRIVGRSVFARGSVDNKGQHLAHLNAVEAYLKTGTELPCDLTFLVEGEEEVGSKSLGGFLKQHAKELACDAVVISDTGLPGKRHPAVTTGLRGIAALELKVTGPNRDLHSGAFGGSIENPAMALCRLLARMHDQNGHVTIPGFYKEVLPISREERAQFNRLPEHKSRYRKLLGAPALFGEKGFTHHEQRSARPTFEINGLTSGYQGQGSKTIVPSWASAKVTMRLVPNQEPRKIIAEAVRHLRKLCPKTVRLEIRHGHGAEPYLIAPGGDLVQAGMRALEFSFGYPALLVREGGTIPVVSQFKNILGVDTLLLGLSLPDDNAHSPNEKFDLDVFAAGMRMSAKLWEELGAR